MAGAPAAEKPAKGRLADNIVHFARALRKAGVPVGTSQVRDAVRAAAVAGFSRRDDFYHLLRATLITRAEHLDVFHQVFTMFWRDPEYLEKMIRLLSPMIRGETEEKKKKAAERRASEALGDAPKASADAPVRTEVEIDAQLSWSETETLRAMDFEQMSATELARAARAIEAMRLPVRPVRTRRARRSPVGTRPDFRATMRGSLRRAGEIERVVTIVPRERPPDLVALCDISGSMSTYSRMMMHFLHALTWARVRDWRHVHAFTFGTQLTNITRALHLKDPDRALAAVGHDATDWEGGTRIGVAIETFNRQWSRRVLGQGAVVLLITDGLERGDADLLSAQMERLHLSCRQLIWLNPLLRYAGFAPLAGGIRAMMPHVDRFHACHSLDSLADLTRALTEGRQDMRAA